MAWCSTNDSYRLSGLLLLYPRRSRLIDSGIFSSLRNSRRASARVRRPMEGFLTVDSFVMF